MNKTELQTPTPEQINNAKDRFDLSALEFIEDNPFDPHCSSDPKNQKSILQSLFNVVNRLASFSYLLLKSDDFSDKDKDDQLFEASDLLETVLTSEKFEAWKRSFSNPSTAAHPIYLEAFNSLVLYAHAFPALPGRRYHQNHAARWSSGWTAGDEGPGNKILTLINTPLIDTSDDPTVRIKADELASASKPTPAPPSASSTPLPSSTPIPAAEPSSSMIRPIGQRPASSEEAPSSAPPSSLGQRALAAVAAVKGFFGSGRSRRS